MKNALIFLPILCLHIQSIRLGAAASISRDVTSEAAIRPYNKYTDLKRCENLLAQVGEKFHFEDVYPLKLSIPGLIKQCIKRYEMGVLWKKDIPVGCVAYAMDEVYTIFYGKVIRRTSGNRGYIYTVIVVGPKAGSHKNLLLKYAIHTLEKMPNGIYITSDINLEDYLAHHPGAQILKDSECKCEGKTGDAPKGMVRLITQKKGTVTPPASEYFN